MKPFRLIGVSLFALAASPVPAQEKDDPGVLLRCKFEEGAKFTWISKQKMAVEIEELPEEFQNLIGEDEIGVEADAELAAVVKETGKEGAVLECTFRKLSVKGNLIFQMIEFEYDADKAPADPKEEDPEEGGDFGFDIEEMLHSLVKKPLRIRVGERGAIEHLDGGARKGWGREYRLVTLHGFLGLLPEEKIEIGKSWKTTEKIQIPNLPLKIDIGVENTFDATKDVDGLKCAVLKSKFSVDSSGKKEEDEEETPFQIDAKMSGEGEGTTTFAIEPGRVVSSSHKATVKIDADLENPTSGDAMKVKAKVTLVRESELKKQ